MGLERPRFQLGMELHADEPGMVLIFDDFRQHAVGRKTREFQAVLLQPVLIGGIDLIAVTMALGNFGGAALDPRYPAAAPEYRRISPEPHGAAEIAGL